MVLALEGRYENYTLGKKISLEQVQTMSDMAIKHGFAVSGFRRFEQAVTNDTIERVIDK
jgi:hypothetical protein